MKGTGTGTAASAIFLYGMANRKADFQHSIFTLIPRGIKIKCFPNLLTNSGALMLKSDFHLFEIKPSLL